MVLVGTNMKLNKALIGHGREGGGRGGHILTHIEAWICCSDIHNESSNHKQSKYNMQEMQNSHY